MHYLSNDFSRDWLVRVYGACLKVHVSPLHQNPLGFNPTMQSTAVPHNGERLTGTPNGSNPLRVSYQDAISAYILDLG